MDLNLETKFIEGTNNQYSIRNDGVVIQHFKYHATGRTLFKERELIKFKNGSCTLTLNKRNVSFSLRANLKKYFNIKYCTDCNCLVEFTNNSYQCDQCKVNNKETNRFSKAYMARIMRMPVQDLDEELYQAAKTRLILKRKLKQS
jgi:hypothetical protein